MKQIIYASFLRYILWQGRETEINLQKKINNFNSLSYFITVNYLIKYNRIINPKLNSKYKYNINIRSNEICSNKAKNDR